MNEMHFQPYFLKVYRTDSNPCFVVICLASAVATISIILLLASGDEQASTATIATCSLVIDPPKKVSAHLQMNNCVKFRYMVQRTLQQCCQFLANEESYPNKIGTEAASSFSPPGRIMV